MLYSVFPEYIATDKGVTYPKGWSFERLRFSIVSNPVKSEGSNWKEDTLVSFLPMEAVGEYGGIDLSKERPIGDVYEGYTYFANGDIVIAKITPCFENGKGAIAHSLKNGVAFGTTEFHVVRPVKGISQRWLFYLSISHAFRNIGASEMLGAGGQKRVPETFIKDFRTGIPSLSEQQKIADFLDWKTGQIDALIAKKKQLIEKLKEKRIALITHAVTKGLNPNTKMKDSGVPWLGEVPGHWEVRRLKFAAIEPLKYGANESAEFEYTDFPRYIRITDIKEDGSLHSDTFRSLLPEVAEPFILSDGDVLLARSGATVGKSFQYSLSWGKAAYAGYLIRFRVDSSVLLSALAYYFTKSQIYWANIESTLIQSTIQNFNAEKYGSISIPIPPLEEQNRIVIFLNENTKQIDDLITKNQQLIEKLTEYRTALITAATTGKIDVRRVKIGGAA